MPGLTKEQHIKMAEMYRSGKSLAEVGTAFCVTRERVRQILAAMGISKKEGGMAVKVCMRKASAQAARDVEFVKKYGCTEQQFLSVRGSHKESDRAPLYAFIRQRLHARNRGIEWKLNFWQWWNIWDRSGRWSERGRQRDAFVMCRYGDIGAYEEGNVFIGTLYENSREGRALTWDIGGKSGFNLRVFRAAGGRRAVAEALGYHPSYISSLGGLNYFPASWKECGHIKTIARMTAGAYTEAELEARVRTCRSEA